jgi:hypothetical protein
MKTFHFPGGLGSSFRISHFLTLLFFLLFFLSHVNGQTVDRDSLTVLSRHRANKAALLSALLPGAGQVYNHKYWKVPILAAGTGTLIYYLHFNTSYYKQYKTAYIQRADGDPGTVDDYPNLSLNEIGVRKDYYRRNRDLCYILFGGLYILNIVDAYVDAQLRGFDISDDLSLKVTPDAGVLEQGYAFAGVRLSFTFSHP